MNSADEKIASALAQADAEEFKNMDMTAADNWIPSEKFEKSIGKLLKHRKEPFIKIAGNARKSIAAVACAFLVIFGAAMSVEASREFIVGFVISVYKDMSSIFFDIPEELEVPIEIETKYYPTYVPNGYEIEEHDDTTSANSIFYYNENGEVIIYEQSVIKGNSVHLNTEDATLTEILFGKFKGYYYFNKNRIVLIWTTDEYSFYISAPEKIPVDEILKIAESVK